MNVEPEWEHYASGIDRIKVEGGHIYNFDMSLCFVPDIDLKRYQAHLRDAYKKGFEDGSYEALKGIKEDVQTEREKGS